MPCNLIHYFFLRDYVTVPAQITVRSRLLISTPSAPFDTRFCPSPSSPISPGRSNTRVFLLFFAIQAFSTLRANERRSVCMCVAACKCHQPLAKPTSTTQKLLASRKANLRPRETRTVRRRRSHNEAPRRAGQKRLEQTSPTTSTSHGPSVPPTSSVVLQTSKGHCRHPQ